MFCPTLLTFTLQYDGRSDARSVVDRSHPLEMRRHSPASSIRVIGPEDPDPGGLDASVLGYDESDHTLNEGTSPNSPLSDILESPPPVEGETRRSSSTPDESEPRPSSLTAVDPALPVHMSCAHASPHPSDIGPYRITTTWRCLRAEFHQSERKPKIPYDHYGYTQQRRSTSRKSDMKIRQKCKLNYVATTRVDD